MPVETTAPGGMCAPDLLPLVYADLRAAARRLMSAERRDHTLQPTALVSEAYLRLSQGGPPAWASPREFFLAAALAMRRILVEHARKRGAKKRGGGDWSRTALDGVDVSTDENCGRLLALDEAIARLETEDARAATVVRLRFFAGLDVDEAASVLGVSRRTALRDWEFARARLFQDLSDGDGGD